MPTVEKENSNKKRKTMKGVSSPKSKKMNSERKVVNTTKYKCLSRHNSLMDSFILDFYLKSIKEQPEPSDMVWLMSNFYCQQICCGSWIENQDFMNDIQRFQLFHSTTSKFIGIPIFEGNHVFSVIIHIEATVKHAKLYWFDSGPKSDIEPLAIKNIEHFVKQISSLFGGLDTDQINVDSTYLVSPNQKRKSNLCWAFCIQTFIELFDSPVDTFHKIKNNKWSSFLVREKIKGLRSLIKQKIRYYKPCEKLNCDFVSVSQTDMARHNEFSHQVRTSETEPYIDKESSIDNLYNTDTDTEDDQGKYSDGEYQEDMQVDQESLLETGIKDALADKEDVSYCPVEITPMVRCSATGLKLTVRHRLKLYFFQVVDEASVILELNHVSKDVQGVIVTKHEESLFVDHICFDNETVQMVNMMFYSFHLLTLLVMGLHTNCIMYEIK